MNRDEKSAAIEEIAAQIEGAEAIFAVDYRGISVAQAADLRAQLRESDASFRVVKNRLTKLAADRAGEERLTDLLEGPTALAFIRGDTAAAAKAISTFNKAHDVLNFKGGFMGELLLDEDQFRSIARLPSREVLDGQLAGVVASPLTGLVRGLGSMIQGLATQLGQIAEKGLVSGAAPAEEKPEEPAAEEPSAEEPAAEEATAEEPTAEADEEAPAEQTPAEEAPAEEPPTESGAEAESPAEDDPSKPEGEDDESAETSDETDKKEEE